jgi:sugar lactone lactonase YvrE
MGSRLAIVIAIATHILSAQGNITTYAGGGGLFSGDGTPAISAQIARPSDVSVDSKGNIIFGCPPFGEVMQVTQDGILHILAGNGLITTSGDGGPARAASLALPNSVKASASGTVYVADPQNSRIRAILPDGTITTVAGTGAPGFSGDGGPATNATLNSPEAVAVDAAGNVYIADSSNNRVRMVSTKGVISTVAGNGSGTYSGDGGPASAAGVLAPLGNITTFAGGTPGTSLGDDGPATKAHLSVPMGLAFDSTGRLYIADAYNDRVRRVNTNGIIETVAGNGTSAFAGDGGLATAASLGAPGGVALASDGSVYIADTENDRIRKIATDGTISTVAGSGAFLGDGGPSTAARMALVIDQAMDKAGNLYILTFDRRVRKVTPNGIITTYAGSGRTKANNQGDGGLATNAGFQNPPTGIALGSDGSLYIANNLVIRKVTTDGLISTFVPAVTSNGNRITIDSADNLYLAISNPGAQILKITPNKSMTPFAGTNQPGFSGDGGPGLSAQISSGLGGMTVGPDGSLYICDGGNNRVRRVDPKGIITTVAGNGSGAYSGDGGPAISAGLQYPNAVAFDSKGNLYIASAGRVRKVATDGTITTFAGSGRFGYSGDGGTALAAAFGNPIALAFDSADNLYVGDSANERVRQVQGGPAPFLLLSQKGLTFRVGSTPPTQSLTVVNSGQGTVNWSVTTSVASGTVNWLSATPTTGSSPAGQAGPALTVKADPTPLAPGDYYGQVLIGSPGVPNSPQSVTVVLSVPSAGATKGSTVQPGGLLFTSASPQSLTLSTTTTGGSKFGANVVFGDGRQWFTFQPSSGSVQPNAPVTMPCAKSRPACRCSRRPRSTRTPPSGLWSTGRWNSPALPSKRSARR